MAILLTAFWWRSIVRAGASRSLGGGKGGGLTAAGFVAPVPLGGGSGARLGAIRLVASVSLGGGRGAGLAPSRSVASESMMLLPMIAFTSGA
jgi:hypothetical protein